MFLEKNQIFNSINWNSHVTLLYVASFFDAKSLHGCTTLTWTFLAGCQRFALCTLDNFHHKLNSKFPKNWKGKTSKTANSLLMVWDPQLWPLEASFWLKGDSSRNPSSTNKFVTCRLVVFSFFFLMVQVWFMWRYLTFVSETTLHLRRLKPR